jgi:hypothetical protein
LYLFSLLFLVVTDAVCCTFVMATPLTTYLQLVPWSRKRGSVHPLPQTPSWLVRSTFDPIFVISGCYNQ